MNFRAVHLSLKDPRQDAKEMLIALLSTAGYEGFLETDDGVVGYVPDTLFKPVETLRILFQNNPVLGELTIEDRFILEKNWNELWERNYDPVIINHQVLISAPFHQVQKKYRFEIIIEPKMSFGTGHHETTALMIELMLTTEFSTKKVLDIGCGTGILGILASKMGATSVTCVDINEWAYENTLENAVKNQITAMNVCLGNCRSVKEMYADVILANITRNILIEDMPLYAEKLSDDGFILMSGILAGDLEYIRIKALGLGLACNSVLKKKDWIAVKFCRI